jgi:hypothetical protein
MKIKIDDRFRIDIDDRNYTLVETYIGKDKDGNEKEQTRVYGHFVKLESVIERIIVIKDAENENTVQLEEYIKMVRNYAHELRNSVREIARELEEEE